MLIDDNETDNFISKSIITGTQLAYQILDFTSASSAKAYLKKNANNPENLPDLILLDINMPIVSGIMFLYDLENIVPNLSKNPAVVILSSFEKNCETDKLINTGRVLRYLTKPLNPEIFKEIVLELNKTRQKVA
jgi:response regulator RpfG family c-di-GMP phosphodiesterase